MVVDNANRSQFFPVFFTLADNSRFVKGGRGQLHQHFNKTIAAECFIPPEVTVGIGSKRFHPVYDLPELLLLQQKEDLQDQDGNVLALFVFGEGRHFI